MNDPRILGPIPTPPAQRWREVRLLYLPRTVFAVGVLVAAWLWVSSVSPATVVAEAEIQQFDVRAAQAGIVTNLNVALFESVRAGQIIGYVRPATARAPEVAMKAAGESHDAKITVGEDSSDGVPLVALVDGTVAQVLRRAGEPVQAGEAVVRITSRKTNRLTGYLRQPLPFQPKTGMLAVVRTRGAPRQSGVTTIIAVGIAMEPIPGDLAVAMRLPASTQEHALRLHFAMPSGFSLRPGEQVDVTIH